MSSSGLSTPDFRGMMTAEGGICHEQDCSKNPLHRFRYSFCDFHRIDHSFRDNGAEANQSAGRHNWWRRWAHRYLFGAKTAWFDVAILVVLAFAATGLMLIFGRKQKR